MKLRLDEMIPTAIARELRGAGHDVDAVAEHPASRGLRDSRQLERASDEDRIFVTYDVGDYVQLARERGASGEPHGGIVFLSSSRFPPGTIGPVVKSLEALLDEPAPPPAGFAHWLQ